MTFTFKEKHLKRLCELNFFPVPTIGMIFFGLRGCLPTNVDNCNFSDEHTLVVQELNYTNPRCTLGQWLPEKGTIALFPGSTVPHRNYISSSIGKNGVGTNQLSTGFYLDYRKGIHKAGKPTAHEAFRQTQGRPIRRTADDYDYQNDDKVDFINPYDDLHAAWCQSVNSINYSSAGCQVIIGYPKCPSPGHTSNIGPWKVFHDNAYGIAQQSFPYVLMEGRDAERVAESEDKNLSVRLRFGSENQLVSELQTALRDEQFYEGEIDFRFQERTWKAVMNFQTARFGPLADDGIVGPVTAEALKIRWTEQ